MNKTLALIAALGLVVAAPAFANEEAAAPAKAEKVVSKTEAKSEVKVTCAKDDEKCLEIQAKEAAKEAAKAPAAGKVEEKK